MHQMTVLVVFTMVLAGLGQDGGCRHEARVGYQDIYVPFWVAYEAQAM